MNKKLLKLFRPAQQHQRGAVMIVGLVMVLLLTIIGLSAMRGSNMQELMTGNMRDRNLAFQTAEAGLRIAENSIDDLVNNSFTGNGLWKDLNVPGALKDPIFTWDAATWSTAGNFIEVNNAEDLGLASAPRYVIERVSLPLLDILEAEGSGLGQGSMTTNAPDVFRITSRSVGANGTAEVILQSTFKTNFTN